MAKTINFCKRNLKELLRDPLLYVFCLGFPIVMLALFQIINNYTNGSTPVFELKSLLPGIIMFSYTFAMLLMALIVSKDRQTFFLKRLYSSPMRAKDFVLGYAIVGIIIGVCQTVVCILAGGVVALITKQGFVGFGRVLLLFVSQMPILVFFVFAGILIGTAFNDKAAPGICSILISVAGVLGGCWMPLDTMGGFETICRVIPFYPSVYIGRVVCGAKNAVGAVFLFDKVAYLGLLVIGIYTVISVLSAFLLFEKNMVSDN